MRALDAVDVTSQPHGGPTATVRVDELTGSRQLPNYQVLVHALLFVLPPLSTHVLLAVYTLRNPTLPASTSLSHVGAVPNTSLVHAAPPLPAACSRKRA